MPMMEIRSNGSSNIVQDLGRMGWLSHGVSGAGAMDGGAFRIANAMVGNHPDCATIEINLFPFKVKFLSDTTVAWTGADSAATIGNVAHPPWWSTRVRADDILTIAPPRRGARAYLACAGGIDVPPVLGSRSTDLKAGFGGPGTPARRSTCLRDERAEWSSKLRHLAERAPRPVR
jgi:allophanate hydrolase subunit 2